MTEMNSVKLTPLPQAEMAGPEDTKKPLVRQGRTVAVQLVLPCVFETCPGPDVGQAAAQAVSSRREVFGSCSGPQVLGASRWT